MPDPILRLAPVMTILEILVFQRRLLAIAERFGRVDVLEWGTGGSTVYFPDFLAARQVPFSWLAIEHHPDWFQRVADLSFAARDGLDPDARFMIELKDPTFEDLKVETAYPMDAYVGHPATVGRTWNLIHVDGRRRRRCLLEAARLLEPGGLVLLHDAHRAYYHGAFTAYRHGTRVKNTTFWEGRTA